MCGIIGYAGGGKAAEKIYEGLKRLEYRGYDSAGIAVYDGGEITVIKKCGRVEKLAGAAALAGGSVGIGHTRWATHGKPSDVNAHPHRAGKFVIVHNGIVENYAQLRRDLESGGARFVSETDSEVIAHLLVKNYSGDLLSALAAAVKSLKGSYAVLAACEGVEGFAVAKYKSPVLLGFGEGENYCASDEPALAGKCGEICVLEDGDLALVTAAKAEIFNGGLKPVKRKKFPCRAEAADLALNGCPHYMIKEIREVPAAIKNTVSAFADCEDALRNILRGADRIYITGCGTAYHAGLVGKYYIEKFARMPAEAETAGEFRYKNPIITRSTAVIALSQSGETADTVEAASLARVCGAKVIAVTNSPYSELTRFADAVVPVEAGSEICVAATKSYSGQLAAMFLIAKVLAELKEPPAYYSGEPAAALLSSVPDMCREIIGNTDLDKLASVCAASKGVYFLGRECDYAVALEGSLKLKEVSYIPGEGYPAGELKHGTLALVDEGITCVALMTRSALVKKCENAVNEVLSRGGRAAVITTLEGVGDFKGKAEIIKLPKCAEELSPFLSSTALQLLAYRTAVILGRDPDKPRNLAKSVTVE